MASIDDLFSAIRRRETSAVQALLDADPSLAGQRAPSGQTPAILAIYCRAPEVLALLRERGAALDVFEAAAAGDEARLCELLDREPAVINAIAQDGWTPLHLAAHFRHEGAVGLLLARGADVRQRSRNSNENTALHAAAAGNAGRRLIARLLDAGVEVDAPQSGGFTGLHEAAGTGNEDVVRLLLDAGASPAVKNHEGKTPAMLATEAGHAAIARLLSGDPQGGPGPGPRRSRHPIDTGSHP
jgi:ankyrin repeat protein